MTEPPSGEDAARDMSAPLFDRYDARLVQELAIGQEPEDEVLARYGFTPAETEKLLSDPVLKTEVAALVQELKRAGTMAKIKARFVAEDLIGQIWSKTREGTRSIAEMLDVLKIMAKIGDLEPRDASGKMTGTIVRVDLNFGMLGFNPQPRTIHATASSETPPAEELAAVIDVDARPVVDSPDGTIPISGHLADVFEDWPVEAL